MTQPNPPSALMVFLFTDLVDSTRWKQQLRDVAYAECILKPHNDLCRRLLSQFPDGKQKNFMGDGYLITFTSPSSAVHFALRFHEGLRQYRWSENITRSGRQPETRIGIHLGEAFSYNHGDDKSQVTGQAVDLAARIMGLAVGGQTLLTRHAFDSARQYVTDERYCWLSHGPYRMKGSEDPLEVYEVGVPGQAPLVPPPDSDKARRVDVDSDGPTGRWAPPKIDAGAVPTDSWTPAADGEAPETGVELAPPQAEGELGRLGHYRILKELGRGGMGTVLLAEDMQLERPVALKVIRPQEASYPQARARFLREARAAAKLNHDNVVRIYQVGEERGVLFIAMELLKGTSLEDYLVKKPNLSPGQVIRLAREMVEGLKAAHAIGLIHRDIKPANIWLEAPKGRVKLLDFGLAREQGAEHLLTMSGAIVGTPKYMSPEQADGKPVDARSDLFSLGVVLYRLCTNKEPFTGASMMAVLTSLAVDTPIPVRELNPVIPPELERLIDRMLAKEPGQRAQTAAEVGAALLAISKKGPVERAETEIPEAKYSPDERNGERTSTETLAARSGIRSVGESSGPTVCEGTANAGKASRSPGKRLLLLFALPIALAALVVVAALLIRGSNSKDEDRGTKIVNDLNLPPGTNKKNGTETMSSNPSPVPPENDIAKPDEKKNDAQLFTDLKKDFPKKVEPKFSPTIELKGGETVEIEIAPGASMKFCFCPPSNGKVKLGSPKSERQKVLEAIAKDTEPTWLQSEAEEVRGEFETTKGFWLGKFPVTQGEWAVMFAGSADPKPDPSHFKPTEEEVKRKDFKGLPVEQVSHQDCRKLIGKLNAGVKNGSIKLPAVFAKGRFCLPLENEWEYAARGGLGNKRAYYFGDELNGELANCDGNYPFGALPVGPYLRRTSEVGSYEKKEHKELKAKHPWGLCDMAGNVFQWCEDKYENEDFVVRGSSWVSYSWACRSAFRLWYVPAGRSGNAVFGCRVCFRLDP